LTEGKLHPSLIDQTNENLNIQSTHWKGKPMLLDDDCFMKVKTRSSKCQFCTWHREMEKSPSLFTFHWRTKNQWKCSNICPCLYFYLEITAPKLILGIINRGQKGLELSHIKLLRCLTKERHNGKIFICPNANLMRNDIRLTCLGSIFFNLPKVVKKRCQHFIMKKVSEDVRQVSDREILMFSMQSERDIRGKVSTLHSVFPDQSQSGETNDPTWVQSLHKRLHLQAPN